jgi:hypothetical protein
MREKAPKAPNDPPPLPGRRYLRWPFNHFFVESFEEHMAVLAEAQRIRDTWRAEFTTLNATEQCKAIESLAKIIKAITSNGYSYTHVGERSFLLSRPTCRIDYVTLDEVPDDEINPHTYRVRLAYEPNGTTAGMEYSLTNRTLDGKYNGYVYPIEPTVLLNEAPERRSKIYNILESIAYQLSSPEDVIRHELTTAVDGNV